MPTPRAQFCRAKRGRELLRRRGRTAGNMMRFIADQSDQSSISSNAALIFQPEAPRHNNYRAVPKTRRLRGIVSVTKTGSHNKTDQADLEVTSTSVGECFPPITRHCARTDPFLGVFFFFFYFGGGKFFPAPRGPEPPGGGGGKIFFGFKKNRGGKLWFSLSGGAVFE